MKYPSKIFKKNSNIQRYLSGILWIFVDILDVFGYFFAVGYFGYFWMFEYGYLSTDI